MKSPSVGDARQQPEEMWFLIRLILFCFDPFGVYRKYFFQPVFSLGSGVLEKFNAHTRKGVDTVRDAACRMGIVTLTVVFIVWSAIFLYVVFYYVYMPPISHTRPVHMQFKPCVDTSIPCSFPHAHISLTKRQQLLMVGQSYKIVVNIDMPESPQNRDLGMFMVCAEMRDQDLLLRGHSCRSAIMRYRSPLIHTLTTWGLSPLYLFGLREEFQRVPVEIFPQYVEERQHPITDIYVEIQSHKIQFYTVTLHLTADFTGLRYIMFNWPILTAVVGVSTNLLFIVTVFALSWYQWTQNRWIRSAKTKFHERRLKKLDENYEKNNSKSIKSAEDFEEEDNTLKIEEIENEESLPNSNCVRQRKNCIALPTSTAEETF